MRWFRQCNHDQFWMATAVALMLRHGMDEVVLSEDELIRVRVYADGLNRRTEVTGSAPRVRVSIIKRGA